MARPRHAASRRTPVIAGVAGAVVALVISVISVMALTQLLPGHDLSATTGSPSQQGGDNGSGASGSPETPGSDGSSGSGSAATSPTNAGAAAAARKAAHICITRVRSTDEVLNQAAIGIRNWEMHVQAQTDADHGKISVDHMKHTFKKTKLEGPDDISRYREAKKKQQAVGNACATVSGATAATAKKLKSCQQRVAAQNGARKPADVAMGDWEHHLADMRRSAAGEVPGERAQQIWLSTWRKAPKHLKPYEQAISKVQAAPTCT